MGMGPTIPYPYPLHPMGTNFSHLCTHGYYFILYPHSYWVFTRRIHGSWVPIAIPTLGGHELLRRPVTALRLARCQDRCLFHGDLLHLRVRRQQGEELLLVGVLLLAQWWSWLLRRRRWWRWGRWWWWRAGTASREHGIGCEAAARHFLPAVGGCEPTSEATSYL
jgi:hypothetical protein